MSLESFEQLLARDIKPVRLFILSIAFPVYLWMQLAYRLLFGTLLGVLFTSIIFYILAAHYFLSSPFTASELLAWFATLSAEAKAAIATTLMTVVGFVAAFWAASAAWKKQIELQVRTDAAEFVRHRFAAAIYEVDNLAALVSTLLDSVGEARAIQNRDERAPYLVWANAQPAEFAETTRKFHLAYRAFSDIWGAYGEALMTLRKGWNRIERVGRMLEEVSNALDVRWPVADINSPTFATDFLSRVDDTKLAQLNLICERVNRDGSAIVGSVRGEFTKGTLPITLSAAVQVTKYRRLFGAIASKTLQGFE